MADTKETICFEFGKDENLVLSELSLSLRRLGVIVLVAGLFFVAYLVISFIDPVPLLAVSDARNVALASADYALWILIALLVIYLSVMVVRLARPIRLIAETTGADVGHLMEFAKGLTRLSRTCFSALVVICVLMATSLVLLVLVF